MVLRSGRKVGEPAKRAPCGQGSAKKWEEDGVRIRKRVDRIIATATALPKKEVPVAEQPIPSKQQLQTMVARVVYPLVELAADIERGYITDDQMWVMWRRYIADVSTALTSDAGVKVYAYSPEARVYILNLLAEVTKSLNAVYETYLKGKSSDVFGARDVDVRMWYDGVEQTKVAFEKWCVRVAEALPGYVAKAPRRRAPKAVSGAGF